jgi:hypothetical protein
MICETCGVDAVDETGTCTYCPGHQARLKGEDGALVDINDEAAVPSPKPGKSSKGPKAGK